MTNPPSRAQILAFNEHNAALDRARRAYAEQPNACADWCVECVQPAGTSPNCEHCKATRRTRIWRAQRRLGLA